MATKETTGKEITQEEKQVPKEEQIPEEKQIRTTWKTSISGSLASDADSNKLPKGVFLPKPSKWYIKKC